MSDMRWVDVSPYSWYYRDVLDSARVELDIDGNALFESIPYNRFVENRGRLVKTYISVENQIEFAFPGYIPSTANPVYAYVEGSPVLVETEANKVFMPNPLSAGLEVTITAMGEPQLVKYGCRNIPVTDFRGTFPSANLSKKANYIFDYNYSLNEIATSLGRKLKRVEISLYPGQNIQDALHDQIGYTRNVFTIINGVLYTSFEYWNMPIIVEYNYKVGEQIMHTSERVVPTSDIVAWNDRFFPNVVLTRAEFFSLLQRLRKNLYNRFTDREYVPFVNNEREIPDIPDGQWYTDDVYDIINEKFLDGCYVFPLYEDNTFNPTGCITRAESVTYLHRFIEWALERFR